MTANYFQMNIRHRAQRTPLKTNSRKTPSGNIIFKLQKIKDEEKVIKEPGGGVWWWAEGKPLNNRGAKIRMISNFSETMQARRQWSEIFKMFGENKTTDLEFCILQNCFSKVKKYRLSKTAKT